MIIYMEMGRDSGRIGMRRARERIHIEGVLCEFFFYPGKGVQAMQVLMELNRYRQQAISSLTQMPSDMFQGNGNNFRTLGKSFFLLSHLFLISVNQKKGSNTGQIQMIAKVDL